MLILEEVL